LCAKYLNQLELYLDLHDGDGPLRARLERALRAAVRSGRLAPYAPLPSSRVLAAELGISRGVVVEAYEQLTAEGFLVARRGSATRVAEGPGDAERAPAAGRASRRARPAARGAEPAAADLPPLRFDLRPGLPELGAFPRRRWLAAVGEAVRELPDERLGYGDPRGAVELREALAAYLGRARGVLATPDRIVVAAGLRQALTLLWTALSDSGLRRVGVEAPGWQGQRDTVTGAGLDPVPVPVDGDGIVVDELQRTAAGAVVVTPANQYPTGAVLAPERRTALVEWARRRTAVIVEDDYDAQYRYDRDPVGSVQGLAPDLTVHGGSASKMLAPALAIGWLVLPDRLVEAVVEQKARTAGGGSLLEQVAFARLLESGELDRHLRRTRRLYRRRRERVLRALGRELPGIGVEGAAAGLHVVVRLPAEADETAAVAAARRHGVHVEGMGAAEPALMLGYGRLAEDAVPAAVAALAAALREGAGLGSRR
jgi:GntR family transcriptional regulator / MocR family aminotransferase